VARIYQTSTYGDAQLRATLVASQGDADLWVCRVGSWGLAHGDALWFITPNYADATARIHFGPEGAAELLVCFVGSLGLAGWRREHAWRGRLG
jgi:hypothetical protein